MVVGVKWCGKGDSNPHGINHKILNLARLPFRHSRVDQSLRIGIRDVILYFVPNFATVHDI